MDNCVEYHEHVYDDNTLGLLMSSFDPLKINVTHTMAKEFVLFDGWFSPLPGPTRPNRAFLHSHTANGHLIKGADLKVEKSKTMWELFSEHGITWKNYWQEIPTLLYIKKLKKKENWKNFPFYSSFLRDAKKGRLPQVSFIDPIFGTFRFNKLNQNDGHPENTGRSSYLNTEVYLKKTYEALRSSPQWNSTLWIITFDEHGGFPDHVPPPNAPSPDNMKASNGFLYDRLGGRVAMIMVSPWLKKGSVVGRREGRNLDGNTNGEYKHTSIGATLFKIFGLENARLSKRTGWAKTFEHIFENTKLRHDCLLNIEIAVNEGKSSRKRRSLNESDESRLALKTVDAFLIREGNIRIFRRLRFFKRKFSAT